MVHRRLIAHVVIAVVHRRLIAHVVIAVVHRRRRTRHAVIHPHVAVDPRQRRLDIGFGIDQELRRGHDAFAAVEAAANRDAITGLHANAHRLRTESTVADVDDDTVDDAAADHGFARHVDDVVHGAPFDHDTREHVWPQCQRLVVEAQAHLERARLGIEFGVDVVDDAFEYRAGQIVEFHGRPLPGLHPGHLALEDLGDHPDLVELCNRHHLERRRHVDPLAHAEVCDDAIVLGDYAYPARYGAIFFEARNLGIRDTERQESFSRCGLERCVVALQRGQVLLLCVHQRWRIDLEQELATLDRIAARLGLEPFDPAVDTRVHVLHRILVVDDVPDRLDASGQRSSGRNARTNPEVVRHHGIDPDDAGLCIDLIGVHRHEIHAHRRLAGPVAPVIRVHRRDPVQNLALAARSGRPVAMRVALPLAAEQETGKQQQDRSRQVGQYSVHRENPPRLAIAA